MTLAALIAQRYPSPEWAVFFEVANATGLGAKRHADAVALGIWPSRGHTLIGFEFKSDRRDWLRERKNPEKAEEIAAHCDAWYLVTTADAVAKAEELPEPWGLLIANGSGTKLREVKPCVHFPGRDKSTMTRGFAAAMLRKVAETTVPAAVLHQRIEERVQAAVAATTNGRELEHLRAEVERLRGIQQKFQDISGVRLDAYHGPEKIARAVHAVLNLQSELLHLTYAKKRIDQVAAEMQRAIDEWPTPQAVQP